MAIFRWCFISQSKRSSITEWVYNKIKTAMSEQKYGIKVNKLTQQVKKLLVEMPSSFLELGEALKAIRDELGLIREKGKKQGPGFEEYIREHIDQTKDGIERSVVYTLIGICEDFDQYLDTRRGRESLREVGWSKLKLLRQYKKVCQKGLKDGEIKLYQIVDYGRSLPKRRLQEDLNLLRALGPNPAGVFDMLHFFTGYGGKLKESCVSGEFQAGEEHDVETHDKPRS